MITSNHLVKLGQQNGMLPLGKKDSRGSQMVYVIFFQVGQSDLKVTQKLCK